MSQLNAFQLNAAQISGGGFTPDAPTITPLERAPTSLIVQTSAYVGPGSHAGTTLQVQLAGGDWSVLVYEEVRTSGDLRTFQVADLVASTDYELRALHTSSNGTASAFGATLEARTKGALTEFQQTNLLALYETPIVGLVDTDPVVEWPETGPNQAGGPTSDPGSRPVYVGDGCGPEIDEVSFNGGQWLTATVSPGNTTANHLNALGSGHDMTSIAVARHDGDGLATNNGTIWSCHDFGAFENVFIFQLLQNPDRVRVLGTGFDMIHAYTPNGGGDLDVFAVTYNGATNEVRLYHRLTFLGSATATTVAWQNVHWFEIGQELDPSGVSEVMEGAITAIGIWDELLSDSAREDNTDFAADNFTCAGASGGGGGGGGCVAPTVSFANNFIAAGGPRTDILLLGTPPANHTQSRYRIKRASDTVIVYPVGDTWFTSAIDLLGHTASLTDDALGILLYAEAEWFDGDAMTWCGVGTSGTFSIAARLPASRVRWGVYDSASPR